MSQYNPKIDEYLAKSADFAKPILSYLREIIHQTCPTIQEEVKWGYPHFDYKGDMMLILAAAKNHYSLSFFKAELMTDPKMIASVNEGQKMGYMVKLKTIEDLPPKEILISLIQQAMILNENGIKKAKPKKVILSKQLEMPIGLSEAFAKKPNAAAIFESKSPSFRKEYLVWIIDAKTDATRQKRIDQAVEWISDGKSRFWQYAK